MFRINNKKIRYLAGLCVFVAFSFAGLNSVNAQENYIDDNNDYVDAVGNENTANDLRQTSTNSQANVATSKYRDQFSTGILNYGYLESLYYQFSGDTEPFKDGNPLDNYFTNIAWIKIMPMDFRIPPSWAFGVEFLYFTSTSDSVYSGESDTTGSAINMQMYMLSISVRVFFMDTFKEVLHPYVGLGWGVAFGDFNTTKQGTGEKYYTFFSGPQSYQIIGIQVKLGERYGINGEFKNLRSFATTSDDPFDQGDNNSVNLTLDGVIIGLTGYYRF